nr:MAG: hypothetical protein CR954_00475 [Candidatus Moranbacteria bacterium]
MKETTDVKRLSELSKLTMAMLDEREKIDAMDDVKKQKNAYREYITKIQQYIAQKTSSDSTQNVLRTGVDNDTIEDTKSNNTNTTMKPEQFINAPTPDKQSRFDREVKRRAESSVSESTSQKQDDTGEFLGMRNDEEVRFDYAAEEREKSSQDLAPQDAEKSMAAAAQETPKPQENNAESASQEDVSADENVQENNEATREQLLANLADARTQYARLHFKNEGMMNKIKAAFGSFDTAGDNDLSDAKKSYQDAYRKYRDDMMAEIETLPPQEQKAALLELKKTDDMEGINLYDARVAVKAESRPFGQKVYDLVMKYKELDWQAKLIISGTIFGAGMAVAGTGGFAAGAVGVLAGIKRGLGAGVMGAGVTGVLEAKAQKDERARSQESLAAFRALDAVQQKEILASFDNQSLQDIEGKFHDKIRGRSRRVMAGILTTAAAMTFGLSRAFGMDAVEAPHVEGEHPSGVDDAQASVTEQPAAQMPTQEVPVQEVPSAELILETGSGALVVEEGGSVEGALIKFFVQNHEKLTEGGMGWDPERFNSVEEWAGKRAHGLVKEYMTERSGVDMNLVRPGTEIKIDAHDLKNITITDVDFEHIVPTGEKIMNEPSILETLRTPEEIRTAFGITQEEYNMYQKTDAQRFVNESMELPEHIRTPLQNHLISLQEQGTSLGGRTVSEFLDNTRINILDEAPDATDVVQDAAENVVEHTVSEAEFISTLMGNPQFLASVREQIQNLTDNPAMGRMLSNVKMQSLGNFNPEAAQQMDEIRQRAQEHLGDRMVMPKENPTVGTYMTRLFARAVQEGKVQDIFPGSRYQL